MAPTTLKTTPLYSLHSIITTLLIIIILQCPCFSPSSFTHFNLGNSMEISSTSVNSLIDNTIHVAQEARFRFAQLAAENSLHASSMAINDCVYLLDDSIDHLYSISRSTQNQARGMDNPSPSRNQNTNICSSMSAILANQEMCMEGLDHHFMDINSNSDMKNEPLQAAIYQLNQLFNRTISTITAKKNDSSAQPPQDEPSWLGQLDNSNYKLIANMSEQISAANKVTVALDGSGDYESITAAINAAPSNSNQKFIIYVKRGVYREYIEIPKSKRNLVMIGDGIGATVITGSRSKVLDSEKTLRTATFAVAGCGFMAQDITFENTAGPWRHQAVALLSNANNLVFYRCAFKGYQDTLYAKFGLQFFRECIIYGTVDFICGDAAAVFQKCQIIARKPLPKQQNTVTAQGRRLECSATGYSFHQCIFKADDDLSTSTIQTYLGRPWQTYSRVVVMKSYLGSLIDPLGWTPWDKSEMGLDTLYYGEYMNIGAGSDVKGRVTWPGFHPYMSFIEANKFTVRNFIYGDKWLPSTGVPYDLDL